MCVCVCVRAIEGHQLRKWKRVSNGCLCVCVYAACVILYVRAFRFVCKSGRWPSLAGSLSEDVSEYRGAVVNGGSVSLFSTSEGPYRPPQAPASQCVLARHSVPSHWDSLPVEHQGVGAFHTTDQSPSQEEELEEVRGVCRRRKWYQDNGCMAEQNIRDFQAGIPEQIGQSNSDCPFVSTITLSLFTVERDTFKFV